MIIYQNTSLGFLSDVNTNQISDLIEKSYNAKIGKVHVKEKMAWTNSMNFMGNIIRNSQISDDCGILIEYKIPLTSMRIDFVITGVDRENNKNFVIVELKQWSKAQSTDSSGVVISFVGGQNRETTHPSYQAYSYKMQLSDYNENVESKRINPISCSYLHNYKELSPEPLKAAVYQKIVEDTPVFLKDDTKKLQAFIDRYVGHGQGMDILYEIRDGNIRPSKKLAEHVCNMFSGNQEFILIDTQKVAFEKALAISKNIDEKTVLIVKGGPGTGKSVISINLLGSLLKNNQNVIFVAPNASFREVMIKKLSQENQATRLKNLFKGSSSFLDCDENLFETIIVDEAHRLKNGQAYQYQGDSQLDDIIKSARNTILFIDDDQRIRPEDIGTVKEIRKVAERYDAKIYEMELEAQFRCSGAQGYINWLDHILQIRETANFNGWDNEDFEFRLFKDPNKLRTEIQKKNQQGQSARLLAGYAWKWTSEKQGNRNSEIEDVEIPEFNFRMPWNSRKARTTWAIDDSGVDQVGCIHTSQGLEFDYVGVIIGDDLKYDAGGQEYFVDWKSYKDAAGKKGLKENPQMLSRLVRNIYKTLMSRGMKGCYVYICDRPLREYIENRLAALEVDHFSDDDSGSNIVKMRINEKISEELKYTECLPIYSFAAACGKFGLGEDVNVEGWVKVSNAVALNRNMFIVKSSGKSMEPLIPDGSYCIFRAPVVGTRNNKIVLVQHNDFTDPETGGSYSIKKYFSEKSFKSDGSWMHEQIVLRPINQDYKPIIVDPEIEGRFTVIAEFVGLL